MKNFDRIEKWFWVIWFITIGLILAGMGFGVWVVIVLLQFFGVI